MAIEIGPIRKPFIYLEGAVIIDINEIDNFEGRVDHAKEEVVTSSTIITSVTPYNQEYILTFDQNVRIVITSQTTVGKKPVYVTANSSTDKQESIFEGSANDTSDLLANKFHETWFTINGKDPVRGKCYLYKYLDTTDKTSKNDAGLPKSWVGLGFLMGSCQTGSDLITLKARTFYGGNKSRIAIAKFKIARTTQGESSQHVGNATPIAK
jgi:hypothetical protein